MISEEICSYVLQEDAISEQMFQSSESALDDLVWTADSIFSSMKVNVILLRLFIVLIQPGMYRYMSLLNLAFMIMAFSVSQLQF
jgi:nuclear pore complex protein Nup160